MLPHDEGVHLGFYDWWHRQANPTAKMLADAELGDLIVKVHDQSRGTYGVPRVTAELRLGLGRVVNRKRVSRLMRERGLQGISRRRHRWAAPADASTIRCQTISCTASSAPTPRPAVGPGRHPAPDR